MVLFLSVTSPVQAQSTDEDTTFRMLRSCKGHAPCLVTEPRHDAPDCLLCFAEDRVKDSQRLIISMPFVKSEPLPFLSQGDWNLLRCGEVPGGALIPECQGSRMWSNLMSENGHCFLSRCGEDCKRGLIMPHHSAEVSAECV